MKEKNKFIVRIDGKDIELEDSKVPKWLKKLHELEA